eukprot:1755639-Amphidinium_carterae.1
MTKKRALILNGKGAPAADAVTMLEIKRSKKVNALLSECLQMKEGSSAVNYVDEREKACDEMDVLVLLRNSAATEPKKDESR